MIYRKLGRSGIKVSALSFGSWVTFGTQMKTKEAEDCMALAYEQGVNFFDNAEVYAQGESEIIMGQVLKKMNWPRDTFLLSSKVFWGGEKPLQLGLSRKHIFDACHAALKRLQVDYLDLYFCHRPDPETPIEETVRAMSDLITQGKILYWGTSEWSREQLESAYEVALRGNFYAPTMEQPEYNLFRREKMETEFTALFERYGLGTTIWSPLASGLLTGKYSKGIPADSRMNLPGYSWLRARLESSEGQEKLEKIAKLQTISDRLQIPLTQMSVAWCLKNPNVSTVILGASKKSQLEESLKSLEVIPKLTDDVLREIKSIL